MARHWRDGQPQPEQRCTPRPWQRKNRFPEPHGQADRPEIGGSFSVVDFAATLGGAGSWRGVRGYNDGCRGGSSRGTPLGALELGGAGKLRSAASIASTIASSLRQCSTAQHAGQPPSTERQTVCPGLRGLNGCIGTGPSSRRARCAGVSEGSNTSSDSGSASKSPCSKPRCSRVSGGPCTSGSGGANRRVTGRPRVTREQGGGAAWLPLRREKRAPSPPCRPLACGRREASARFRTGC